MRFGLIKKSRLLVGLPAAAALALAVPLAAPAGAATLAGAGQATGIVQGTVPTTLACETGGGYVFSGVAITGTVTDGTNVAAGVTSVAPPATPPSGSATGDPLNGTPLGCGTGDALGTELTAAGETAGNVPVVGCNGGASAPCGTGPNASNALADFGTINPGGAFTCTTTPAEVGFVSCSLSGTFVRYGTAVLVDLSGSIGVDVSTPNNPADVTLVADAVPLPQDPAASCGPVTTLFNCSEFTGPYVITPGGTIGATSAAGSVDPSATVQVGCAYDASKVLSGSVTCNA